MIATAGNFVPAYELLLNVFIDWSVDVVTARTSSRFGTRRGRQCPWLERVDEGGDRVVVRERTVAKMLFVLNGIRSS
jgi:hypothetical protein